MITTLQTQNYKKIGANGIRLEEVAPVNYFVGENSSGKTSLLRYIFEMNRAESLWITDGITGLDHLQEYDLKKIYTHTSRNILKGIFMDSVIEYQYLSLDLLALSILQSQQGLKWRILDESLYLQAISIAQALFIVEENLAVSDNGAVLDIDGEELNSGAHKLVNIIYSVLWAHKSRGCKYFMFDSPGNNLHPSWQKHLPEVFGKLVELLDDIQIFVATHSPFVISSAGVLGEDVEKPAHKVYFMIDGHVASKRGVPSSKGNKGYWGSKVAEISSKMLGIGLMDLVAKQQSFINKNSPVLVLCEGEGENADANIYNIIFRNRIPNALFVSSRGSSQLYKSFTILSQIKPGLSADFDVRMLRDRDHEFPTEHSIIEYESSRPNCKVLRKRAIESYMYNIDTAKLVLSLFNKKILKKDIEKYTIVEEAIRQTTLHGVQGSEYKLQLLEWFQEATRGYLEELMRDSENTVMERVAYLIYPGHPVYQELESIIFG